MRLAFVINESAGNGKGAAIWRRLKQQLTVPYEAYFTTAPGQATLLAKQMSTEPTLLVVVGGDGTINEVINGCIQKDVVIGCVRAGSGNDFSRTFIPFETARDIERWLKQKRYSHMDSGRLEAHYFVNNCGIGFDAFVCLAANDSKLKKWLNKVRLGKLSYVYYVVKGLFRFKPFTLTVQMNGEQKVFQDVWFATVSNHPYFGGGMKISPSSNPYDGKMELTVVHRLGKLKFGTMFGSVFFGAHTRFQEVEQFEATSFQMTVNRVVPCHTDGECFTMQQPIVGIEVVPQSLAVAQKE